MKIIKHVRFKAKGGNTYSLSYNTIYPVLEVREDSGYLGYVVIDDKSYQEWVYVSMFEDVDYNELKKVEYIGNNANWKLVNGCDYVIYDTDNQENHYKVLDEAGTYIWVPFSRFTSINHSAEVGLEALGKGIFFNPTLKQEPDLSNHPQHKDTRYGYVFTKEQVEDLYQHGSDANKERLKQIYPDLFKKKHKMTIKVYRIKSEQDLSVLCEVDDKLKWRLGRTVDMPDLELIDTIEKEYKF